MELLEPPLMIATHLRCIIKRVATLPCETLRSENTENLKHAISTSNLHACRFCVRSADQVNLVKLGSAHGAQLNLMSLHLTLVWQLPIIEHKIERHGGRSYKRQCPFDKPDDDVM